MRDELPNGWELVILSELFDLKYGKGLPQEKRTPNGTVKVYGSNGIVGVHDSSITKGPSIIIGRKGSVGEVHLSPEGCWPIDTTYFIDEFHADLPPGYWTLYLKSLRLGQQEKSSAIPGINREDVYAIEVPLPPLKVQRRIVAKLEALLGKVDTCQKRMERIPLILKRFRQAVLSAAFSGRLTTDWREGKAETDNAVAIVAQMEKAHSDAGGHKRGNAAPPTEEVHDLSVTDLPSSWSITDLRTAVLPDRPITYGILKPGPNIPNGVPYVRVADFPNDRLKLSGIRCTTTGIDNEFSRARLRQGDILLSIRGTVGRVCIVPNTLEGANITQDTARLSIQPALITPFVAWFLRADPTQKRMQKATKGVAVRGINIGDVRALQLPVPPLSEQQEIVCRVEALFAFADRIEERYNKAKAQTDKLTQAILAKAFRGELVPQDPNDEPASVLLERIKQERAETWENDTTKGKRKGRRAKTRKPR